MITFKQFLAEDLFAQDEKLYAVVDDDTARRTSEPTRITANHKPLGSQSSMTRGVPVYYAFSYKPSEEPGGSTEILKSFKGKGPLEFPASRRDKFIDDASSHIANQLKELGLKPDVVVTPQSSSSVTAEFATELANKLGIKAQRIGAFEKAQANAQELTRDEVIRKYIDMELFNEKFKGDEEKRRVALRDLSTAIMRSFRKHGMIVSKELRKETAKFVKNIMQSALQGKDAKVLRNKNVMVVDDVLSSGTTMSDLFRVATQELGAKSVFGVTLFARSKA